ncbi:MAG: excinuclease ABC subunit UvrC [Clostridia bacterium]|nr:excinuclease ABC subunit UvrC [Clostridia bacterium]
MFDFETELKNLPSNPGVYLMHNSDGEIIYVGKAKVLKNRVRQYFQNSQNHTAKVRAMVSNIAYFEYIITDTETEALVLECNLIKKHRPKYNILLKDDKHYPYLKVTMNEEYPRVFQVRRLSRDGAKYYGPYVCGSVIKSTLELIQKFFKPPKCHRRFPEDIRKGRPCLNYHINACIAPCTGRVSKEEYREVFKEICKFLDGNHKELLSDLKKKMSEASHNLEFERAASLRDKINAIEEIEKNQKAINANHQTDSDVVAIARENSITFCEVFFVRGGKVIGRESYRLDNGQNSSNEEIITDFIKQFYQDSDYVPPTILTQFEIEDKDAIEKWLSDRAHRHIRFVVPVRGEKAQMVKMVEKNAQKALENHKIKVLKAREKNTVLDNLKELLGMADIPHRIEAYDISNIQGADNVGGMVVFDNGQAAKRKYRIFKIKSFEGADDYAAMSEVIYRRFKHAMDEEEAIKNGTMKSSDAKFLPRPDLILLDGGKGHLSTISELMDMMEIDIPVFGMVKNDKHRTRGLIGKAGEIEISPASAAFKLITNIQDEVHNTAISYHRKLHGKISSELDKIPGIGEKRRKSLLTEFGSVDKIKEAQISDLQQAEGMTYAAAENVYNYFHSKGN